LFYLGQLSHFSSCFGAGVTNLNEPPSSFFAPSPLLQVRSWLHPFKCHCEQKAMRDEGVIYVAGLPLLTRRCTRLPECFHSMQTKLQLLKARYSLIVLKVPLSPGNQFSAKPVPVECQDLRNLSYVMLQPGGHREIPRGDGKAPTAVGRGGSEGRFNDVSH